MLATNHGLSSSLFAIGLTLGMLTGLGGACDRDGTGALRTEISCQDYCDQAKSCDDEVDVDACVSDCRNTVDDCMADEREEALDQLDECAAESCNDFGACTIEAGAECFFGL